MDLGAFWPWIALAGLGAYHGINPGMGWLFAVALGLQEGSRAAVYRAFAPISLGHAAAVAAVVAVLVLGRTVISPDILKYVAATVLVGFGLFKLVRRGSHPRWVGMRVGFRDLTAWSFLMASAHGAGLMLLPVLLNLSYSGASGAGSISERDIPHADYMLVGAPPTLATIVSQLTAISIHTVAMFGVMAIVAIVVYEKVGLAILRRAWLNLDRVWALALIVTGLLNSCSSVFDRL